MTTTRTSSRRRDAAAFAGSLLTLLAVLVGVPAALAVLAGWPLPHGLPSLAAMHRALDEGWSPDGLVVLKAVAVVAWLAWAEIALCLLVELAAALRGGRARRVPTVGWAQPLAARLVAGLLLAQTLTAAATQAAARPPLAAVSLSPGRPAPVLAVNAEQIQTHPAPPPTSSARPTIRYPVQRHDTLWDIAARHLGDPLRWQEIFDINVGKPQPDGRRLTNPDRIYPGWVLDLPSDAVNLPAPAPAPISPAAPAPAASAPAAPAASAPAAPTDSPPPTTVPTAAPVVPPTTTPPPPNRPHTSHPDPAHIEPQHRPRSARPIIDIGLPLLAAGGLIATLDRLRRAQQRRRNTGETVPKPPAAAEPVERKARAIAADDAGVWVDTTLRFLAAQLQHRPGTPPAILGVRAGPLGVEVLLDPPDTLPPTGFDALDDGHVWRLDPDMDLPTLNEQAGVASAPVPTLVSVGDTADGPLLVNLEHLGALAVDGDPERTGAFLAGVALELAVAPWADGVHLVVVGPEAGTLIALDNVDHAPDADALADQLEYAAAARAEELGQRPSTLAARTEAPWSEGWAPTVVLVPAGAATPDAINRLIAPAQPHRSGIAVVTTAATSSGRWRLHIDTIGTATLEPLGMILRCGVDAAALAAAESLLATATQPPAPAEPEPELEAEAVIDLTDTEADTGPAAPEIEVRVLGPVEIVGWAKPTNRKKIVEVLAYLATHPDHPVPSDTLRCAVWPLDDAGRDIGYATFKQALSRARAALGDDPRGYKHLPDAHDGAYRLGPAVGCDWWRLRRLVASAKAAPSGDAIDLLRQALELVRAKPFADAPVGTYAWAYSEQLVADMEREIPDAAARLAGLALDAGDPGTAEWACRQGLLVVPHDERLHRLRGQAAERTGGRPAVERAWRDTRAGVKTADPFDEPGDDTAALYQRLLAGRAATTSSTGDDGHGDAIPQASSPPAAARTPFPQGTEPTR